ncbi:MAG: class II glutamine amidotransferase [Burkholderiales bacterium]|nr:class II glutamine amidotransferase [Burkholderiales bacterium]MDE2452034.1 class II glutamine amidotransferase [Burkholderiales bacterium]
MCQLFALDSDKPTAATFSLAGFAARGGATAEHGDGWGVAFHEGGDCRVFMDAGRASESPLADFLCRHPIRARTIVAHIRRATQGRVGLANCHPFRREAWGRSWTFCHNGDLKDFQPRLEGRYTPLGQTDSEYAFCWLMQELQRSLGDDAAPTPSRLAPRLAELAAQASASGRFNFLLCDGEALYAHASTRLHWVRRRHPFARVRLVDREIEIDLARANRPTDRMVVVATEPLTHGEAWTAFEPGELRVFAGGRSVWSSQAELAAA